MILGFGWKAMGPQRTVSLIVSVGVAVAVAAVGMFAVVERTSQPEWRFLTSTHEASPAPLRPLPERDSSFPQAIDLDCWPDDGIGSVSPHFPGRYVGDTAREGVFAAPLPGALDRAVPNRIRDAKGADRAYFFLESHLGERVGYVTVVSAFNRWYVDSYTACDSYTRER